MKQKFGLISALTVICAIASAQDSPGLQVSNVVGAPTSDGSTVYAPGAEILNYAPAGFNGFMYSSSLVTDSLTFSPINAVSNALDRYVLESVASSASGATGISYDLPTVSWDPALGYLSSTQHYGAGGGTTYSAFYAPGTPGINEVANQVLTANVNNPSGEVGQIYFEAQNAPSINFTETSTGTFNTTTTTFITGDTYNFSFTSGALSGQRPDVGFSDGTSVASPFVDDARGYVLWILSAPGVTLPNGGAVGFSFDPATGASPIRVGPGNDSPFSIGSYSDSSVFNFSGIAPGNYTLTQYTLGADYPGFLDPKAPTGNGFAFLNGGDESINVQVVPEPSMFLGLGLGAFALLRRKRK